MSEKQLEANRRNSKLGGVKSEAGKAISRYNATKHGLLSKVVFLEGEDEEAFVQLKDGLQRHFNPQTQLELLLVDRIIVNAWRLRRIIKLERDIITEDANFMVAPYSETQDTFVAAGRVYLSGRGIFDGVIRYETSIERSAYRAIHELERIQKNDQNGFVS